MVDKNQIKQLIKLHFKRTGAISLDPQGVVSCTGDLTLVGSMSQLPVQFAQVDGDFYCSMNKLTSLAGAPSHVGGYFYCYNNKLTSLAGAPSQVGGNFFCHENPFTSLDGAPRQVGGIFSYTYAAHLPMLRLLAYKKTVGVDTPEPLKKIMDRYAGATNPGDILNCRDEMADAGFEGNAEW